MNVSTFYLTFYAQMRLDTNFTDSECTCSYQFERGMSSCEINTRVSVGSATVGSAAVGSAAVADNPITHSAALSLLWYTLDVGLYTI